MGEITSLLDDARAGTDGARTALFSHIYAELQVLARSRLAAVAPLTLLDTPALINETYLRLSRLDQIPTGNRHVFFSYAAKTMRSVVVDYLRERNARKRGSGMAAITLVTRTAGNELRDPDLLALDEALQDLERVDARCCEVVELRYFAGLSVEEVAELTGRSTATIKRDWRKARAFLLNALRDE